MHCSIKSIAYFFYLCKSIKDIKLKQRQEKIKMKYLKYLNSCSSILIVLVASFITIIISTTSKVAVSRQAQLLQSLLSIDAQIEKLRGRISVQFSHLNQPFRDSINWTVTQKVDLGLSLLYQKLPQFYLYNMKQSPEQSILAKHKCKIVESVDKKLSQQLKYDYVPSLGELFIFVSDYYSTKLQIYSMDCELLARIDDLAVKLVFEEEKTTTYSNQNKDNTQSQLVYLISNKNQLIVIDLLEVKKAKDLITGKNPKLASHSAVQNRVFRLLNNKLILPGETTEIIGVLIKTVNHQTSRSKQNRALSSSNSYKEKSLFVAFDSSQIKVFDEMGTLKISMKEPSIVNDLYSEAYPSPDSLLQVNDKALQFLDIHPQPILVEENWIYLVDTSKYSRQPWGCPYIGNVRKLYVENYHDSEVYVLTDERVLKVKVKPKDGKDASKKGFCEIQKSILYFNPYSHVKKTEDITFSVHKSLIFLENLIYNMTSNTYMIVQSAQSLLEKLQENNSMCSQFSLHPIPNIPPSSKKTPLQKHLTIMLNCKGQTNEVHLFTVTLIKSESSLLVYIIIGFLMVIFFAVKCFKSTSSNYDKELLYPVNFDAEDKWVRREHYEQLKKYMDEAKVIQQDKKQKIYNDKQQRRNNTQKSEDKKNQAPNKRQKSKKQ